VKWADEDNYPRVQHRALGEDQYQISLALGGFTPTTGERPCGVFDAAFPGLTLHVTENGGKNWSPFYRRPGRLRRFAIGSYPASEPAQAGLRRSIRLSFRDWYSSKDFIFQPLHRARN
jgi:hypothetical protein